MKKFFGYFKIIISIALLLALIWFMRDQLKSIGAILLNANKLIISLCLFLLIIGIVIQSYRLKFLLDVQRIHLKIKDIIYLTFIGQFFNNIMPTAIGGDVVKAYFTSNGTDKKLETFTTIVVDRVLGAITIMWIAAVALIFNYKQIENKMVVIAVCVIFAAGTIFTLLLFNKKALKKLLFLKGLLHRLNLEEKLERLQQAINKYSHHKIIIVNALLFSLVAQFIYFFMTYLLALSISAPVSFMFLLLILPIVATISMLPSLNGLGIRESGFVYFLGGVMGHEKAFAFSLLYLGVGVAISLIGGVIFLFKKEFKHIELDKISKISGGSVQ